MADGDPLIQSLARLPVEYSIQHLETPAEEYLTPSYRFLSLLPGSLEAMVCGRIWSNARSVLAYRGESREMLQLKGHLDIIC